jgi:hypothetical protein
MLIKSTAICFMAASIFSASAHANEQEKLNCDSLIRIESGAIGFKHIEDYERFYSFSGRISKLTSRTSLKDSGVDYFEYSGEEPRCLIQVSAAKRRVLVSKTSSPMDDIFWVPITSYRFYEKNKETD